MHPRFVAEMRARCVRDAVMARGRAPVGVGHFIHRLLDRHHHRVAARVDGRGDEVHVRRLVGAHALCEVVALGDERARHGGGDGAGAHVTADGSAERRLERCLCGGGSARRREYHRDRETLPAHQTRRHVRRAVRSALAVHWRRRARWNGRDDDSRAQCLGECERGESE